MKDKIKKKLIYVYKMTIGKLNNLRLKHKDITIISNNCWGGVFYRNNNLEYLSPRTGRAVCKECAKPYVDKLYKLPLDLNITYAFLEKACVEQGVKIPIARIRLS